MWRMLQQDEPDDFVLATGETHPVKEFVEKAFSHVGITIKWEGPIESIDEVGVCAQTGRTLVRVDARYFVSLCVACGGEDGEGLTVCAFVSQRPAEVELLHGTPAKVRPFSVGHSFERANADLNSDR
jgi:GDPmannose 4,6-dehydratase